MNRSDDQLYPNTVEREEKTPIEMTLSRACAHLSCYSRFVFFLSLLNALRFASSVARQVLKLYQISTNNVTDLWIYQPFIDTRFYVLYTIVMLILIVRTYFIQLALPRAKSLFISLTFSPLPLLFFIEKREYHFKVASHSTHTHLHICEKWWING